MGTAEDKEKLRQRFLEKQKLAGVSQNNTSQQSKSPKSKNSKYYEGSSDEEEQDDSQDQDQVKSTGDVMKTFKSFSNLWKDSDEEEADSESSDSSSDSSSEDEEDDDDDDKINETSERKINLEPKSNENQRVNLITRYDPTAEDQDQFMRNDPSSVEDIEDNKEIPSRPDKSFNITTDLKNAFGSSSNSSTGFSFGFLGGGGESNEVSEDSKMQLDANFDSDSDAEEMQRKPKVDLGAKFGMQLKTRGRASVSSKPFFFEAEDSRFADGVKFFFDHKVDVDELRTKFNDRRPILSEILKKKLRNKMKKAGASRNSRKQSTWKGDKVKFKKNFNKSKKK